MKKRVLSILLVLCLLVGLVPIGVSAAAIPDINDSSVFFKQSSSVTCTLASNLMMFRRGAIINRDERWDTLTEANYKSSSKWWSGGMIFRPSALGMKGEAKNLIVDEKLALGDTASRRYYFINYLNSHPEGIVIYLWKSGASTKHAILLTDYDAASDTFYCSDPASSVGSGRIRLSSSSLVSKAKSLGYVQGNMSPQDFVLSYVNQIWRIASGINYNSSEPVKPRPAAPGTPTVSVSNSKVTVSWNDVANETSYNVYLVQEPWGWEDIRYRATVEANATSYTFTDVDPGDYAAFIISMPNDGNIQSGWARFSVSAPAPIPTNCKVVTDKQEYKPVYKLGETVTITPSASNVSGFTLSVREGSSLGTIVFSKWDKFTGPVTFTPTNAGKYVVVISVFDLAGRDVTASDIPNPTCSFEVVAEEDTPDTPLDPTPENSFIDVPNGAYFAKSVNWAVDRGITAGTTQTTFSPNQPCTRAQAVTFLWRAAGSPKPQGSNTKFTDVTPGHYYTDAVQWAVENGITGGTTPTTFSPNDKCTRAQIVCFLHRFHHSPAPVGVSPFTDVPVSVYYSSSVAWAVENGITSGISSTQFGPFNDCSRGQIVTFLYRDMAE